MMTWKNCKKILCVRPDNMGDVLMSAPAISALKETFKCSITLLTSTMAKDIAAYIPSVDEVIVWNVPWVKGTSTADVKEFTALIETLKAKQFDGAVIFTVFSQNPLPTALVLTLAEIPYRLAYCRENPYNLLSHWIPEKEPYNFIRHQVRRDLDLVKTIGANTRDDSITIRVPEISGSTVSEMLRRAGVNLAKPWLIMHPGVSEKKREYAAARWIEAGQKIWSQLGYQLIITGTAAERPLAASIAAGIGSHAYSLAGALSLEAFIALIRLSPLLISVNTGSAHLAAAVQTKVIVLYALTNPQHTPWKITGKILPFSVAKALQSKNEILQFVQQKYFKKKITVVSPDEILTAVREVLLNHYEQTVEEIVSSPPGLVQGMSSTLYFHEP